MKKVLFIIPTLSQTNGVAAFIINYLKNFELDRYQVEVIYNDLRSSKTYIDILKSRGIKLYKLQYIREVGLKKYINAIRAFFSDHNDYDLVYSNVAYLSYFFFKEAKKQGIKNFAIHAHATKSSDNVLKNFLGNLLQKKVNKMINHRFACSKLAGKAMFHNDDFITINNAIDYKKYEYNEKMRKKIRNELNVKEDEKIIGFVGRFTAQKNVYFFVNIIAELPEQYRVIMIGNGQQKNDFIQKIQERKLEERFILIDETASVNDYYSSFDFFLLPSIYEGLPVVGIEAQANGLPTLLSDTITKECDISNNVIYLDRDDYEKWINALYEMKRKNDIILKDDYNIKIQAKKFESKINDIIEKEG